MSRAAKFTLGAIAAIAFASAGYAVVRIERALGRERATLAAFDIRARETADALGDVRAGQQAYVAAGQGVPFWTAKVQTLLDSADAAIAGLRETAESRAAREQLMNAAASVTELVNIDKRAREYVRTSDMLMASDVLFTEGREAAGTAARQVESARIAEHEALDRREADQRKIEAAATGGASGVALLVIVVLVLARSEQNQEPPSERQGSDPGLLVNSNLQAVTDSDLNLRFEHQLHASEPEAARPDDSPGGSPPVPDSSATTTAPATTQADAEPAMVLKRAADLCTDLGRVSQPGELSTLLGRAAEMIEASGLIVWIGSSKGIDLRPVLTHGYPAETLARLPPVSRSADNAAAAAYRTGVLQVVSARGNAGPGAIVAPLLSVDGCIGALAAEVKGGTEASASTQSIAVLVAAQLAGLLAAAPASEMPRADKAAVSSR